MARIETEPAVASDPAATAGVDAALAASGVRIPDVLLPRAGVDLRRWAVVACDQFTSESDYWAALAEEVGEAPSTLRLIYPEVYLDEADPSVRIAAINASMRDYLDRGLLTEHRRSMVLVRRETATGVVRWGLVVALDLEAYDWREGSRTLIRATEGTIESRIPARKQVRAQAPLELPHIVVLLPDPQRRVIEPLVATTQSQPPSYDTELNAGGGRVTGWLVGDDDRLLSVATGLGAVRQGLDQANPILFAMGDGNHSLATAKSIWDDLRPKLSETQRADHPARFCLVEIENLYDAGVVFEPIHRVLFGVTRAAFEEALAQHASGVRFTVADPTAVAQAQAETSDQVFGYLDASGGGLFHLAGVTTTSAADTVQAVIDDLTAASDAEVDYIHGDDVAAQLGAEPGNLAIFLPPLGKDAFLSTVQERGALPRKTFSLGHAPDKRYYLEARRVR